MAELVLDDHTPLEEETLATIDTDKLWWSEDTQLVFVDLTSDGKYVALAALHGGFLLAKYDKDHNCFHPVRRMGYVGQNGLNHLFENNGLAVA
eukprot:m.61548 g.61548  ORF g.61548 m.61548 type:complete len:93 (+) comp11424_c0_seq1:621-899(+)